MTNASVEKSDKGRNFMRVKQRTLRLPGEQQETVGRSIKETKKKKN